jgi:uncharacterized protein YgiM (DUF1202 family)
VKKTVRSAAHCCSLLLLLGVLAALAGAQAAPYERTYSSPVSDVERVVRNLRPTSSGRLPTVDGFVEQGDQPLDRYERGYYECAFQVVATPSGGATVRATAKVTAWYNDPTPARSGYRVLVSNGHIENDFLDQIDQALGSSSVPKPTASAATSAPAKSVAAPITPPKPVELRTPVKIDPTTMASSESSSNKNAMPGVVSSSANQPSQPSGAPPSVETLETLKLQRAAVQKRAQELAADVKNFEDILHNQVRPADLAVVKKPSTHVFSKASETSPVLFSADAEDEFQVLEVEGAWVHVQISGASRGWIRRSQLDLPKEYANADAQAPSAATEQTTDTAPATASLFNISKDETTAFGGKWEPLKGKKVKVIWLEPASPTATSTARQKLAFAKPLFEKAYTEVKSSAAAVDGVVIVFDSADGGQIAATLASLKQLADGAISETAFWKQCSLDPPEAFQVLAKP